MEDKLRIILTRNRKAGGVLTIINQIKCKYPNIQHLSLSDGIKIKFKLLKALSNKKVILNIHGWIGLKPLKILKYLGFIKCKIIYSLHSDPVKELLGNAYKFKELLKLSEKITFVSNYHLENVLNNFKLSPEEKEILISNNQIIYFKKYIEQEFDENKFSIKNNYKIGLITRLSPEKGIEFICSVLCNRFDVNIWGEGPNKKQLQTNYPKIKFSGLSLDFKTALSQVDIFIFTSNWGVWGISLLEAISIGKRFIYPRNENWRDIFPIESHLLSYERNNGISLLSALNSCVQMSEKDFEKIGRKILAFPQKNHVDIYAHL